MSWTEVFPVFTEEQVEEFEALASPEELAELEEWYGVEKVLNARPTCKDIVSISLFWKNVRTTDPELPAPSIDLMKNAVELGLARRFNPWDHYVRPLLEQTPRILEKYPEVSIRVYLASDLEFLIEDLVSAGCEVFLMKSPSLRFAPGGLWRFLPFSESGKRITVTDVDRLNELAGDLERSRTMEMAGLAAWRVPVPNDLSPDRKVCYLPFMGCQFGVMGGSLDVRKLLGAFTWHALRGSAERVVMVPGCGPLPIQSHRWPSYGFDEFFMTVAAYPRLAQGGMLTFVPATARSQLLALDVEYVTWGNPNSELVYFPAGNCCGIDWDPTLTEATKDSSQGFDLVEHTVGHSLPETEPVIAILMFDRTAHCHPEIWAEWLADGGERLRHFCLSNRQVQSNQSAVGDEAEFPWSTEWAEEGILFVRAALALLRRALEDSSCTHFALVSQSCVPVRPPADLIRTLKLDPRSRVRVTPWEDMRNKNLLKAQRVEKLSGIRKELGHFHDQWMILSRHDAEILITEDRTEQFEDAVNPEEFYFATVLAEAGYPPLSHFANRSTTWGDRDWLAEASTSFPVVASGVAAAIAESGCFFACKFPVGSNIGAYGLHREVSRPERLPSMDGLRSSWSNLPHVT